MLARIQAGVPAVAHVGPEHAGQQKAGGYRFALTHAAVGVVQHSVDQRQRCALDHQIKQRIDAARHAQGLQLRNRRQRVPGLQQLEHLIEETALRHIIKQLDGLLNRRGCFGFQLEAQVAELGGKTHGADDPDRVFAVAGHRVTNHAQGFALGIFEAVVVIDHHLRGRVVVHGVDGEVAPHRVLFLRAPDVVAQHATGGIHGVLHAGELAAAGFLVARHLLGRGIVQIGAEGRDLNHLMLTATPVHHMHDTKAPPDDEGPAEQLFDLLGRGVGRHVKVFGPQTQQHVAHSAANDIGLKSGALQGAHHVGGALVHHRRVDAMGADRHIHALAESRFGT